MRILKSFGVAVLVILIAGVAFLVNAFVGNPVSKMLAKNTAQKYIESSYADEDFAIERVYYSFKDSKYHASVVSPSSRDTHFDVTVNMLGGFCYDSYEDNVLSGRNTAERIGKEYRELVDSVLESDSFAYDAHIGFGDIEFCPSDYIDDKYTPSYAIVIEDLILDADYDANEMGARAGRLTLYINGSEVSYKKLSEILLGVRGIFDQAGVKFYAVDLVLEYTADKDGVREDGRVEVMGFLYSDIYEAGLESRVKASDEAAKAYYAEMDAEKAKESIE